MKNYAIWMLTPFRDFLESTIIIEVFTNIFKLLDGNRSMCTCCLNRSLIPGILETMDNNTECIDDTWIPVDILHLGY